MRPALRDELAKTIHKARYTYGQEEAQGRGNIDLSAAYALLMAEVSRLDYSIADAVGELLVSEQAEKEVLRNKAFTTITQLVHLAGKELDQQALFDLGQYLAMSEEAFAEGVTEGVE